MNRRMSWKKSVGVLCVCAFFAAFWACGKRAELKAIQTQRAKDATIVLLSETGELRQGNNEFVVEFRSAATQQLIDPGRVRVSSRMTMPGMAPMSGGIELTPAGETGRYRAKGAFEMSGGWLFTVQWDGFGGGGSTSFSVNVR